MVVFSTSWRIAMKAYNHVSVAAVREARTLLRKGSEDKAALKNAQKIIDDYEKQKTPEFRQSVAKNVQKQLKNVTSAIAQELGLDTTVVRIFVTPRGIVNIAMKAAPTDVPVKLRANVVH